MGTWSGVHIGVVKCKNEGDVTMSNMLYETSL